MKSFFKKKFDSPKHHVNSTVGGNKKNCIDLDDLMEIENARQRALFQHAGSEYEHLFPEFIPHRIFINHVDSFNGSHFVKWLSQISRKVGKSSDFKLSLKGEDNLDHLEEEEFDGDNESETEEELEENEELDKEDTEEMAGEMSDTGDSEEDVSRKRNQAYEIIGTLDFINNPKYKKHENVLELLDNEKKLDFLEKLLTCGIIIYDITGDLSCHPNQIEEAKWIAESIVRKLENFESCRPKLFAKSKDRRTFILISPLLTWAKTKPIDPDNPTLPFTERDFRKRKPHPNYKLHCELEKRIIELGRKYPNLFRTIVIGTGVPYGDEEDILSCYFTMAWQGVPHLPIFKPGANVIPLIHINTLCGVLQLIIEAFPQKYKYLIATDPSFVTLNQIVKLLAEHLGNGKTVIVNKEEAFLYPQIKQKNYDMLTNNLHIVPGYILDKVAITSNFDKSFAENILKLIEDFKHARGLMPIKIFIHGPPASGRSFLAKRLSAYYGIPYLDVKTVVNDAIQDLKDKIQTLTSKHSRAEEANKAEKITIEGDEETDDENEYDAEELKRENLQSLKEKLKELEINMDGDNPNLSDEHVLRLFKERMLSNECQNKGYVIDGYPETLELTKLLYEPSGEHVKMEGEDFSETGQGDVSHLYNGKIMPDFIESLDASDEFLIERVIKMPEVNGQNKYYEESEMCRKLSEFRDRNTEDNTPLIFYDELDFHPMVHNIENDLDPQMEITFKAIIQHIGPAIHFGKRETELEEIIAEQKLVNKHKEELRAQREEIKRAAQQQRESIENWMFLKNQEVEMEEKALLVMSMPLRQYLMKYIFPTLTRGLVEVARIRPKDPVDFLSEFLFRENPDGKMFHPDYDEKDEKLASALREYEDSLAEKKTSDMKSSEKTYSTEKSPQSGAVSRIVDLKCSLVSSKASKKSKPSRSRSRGSRVSTTRDRGSKDSGKSDSWGVCTCRKSPSLSTCSSDVTPSTPSSRHPSTCTCTSSESCEPCEPCEPRDFQSEGWKQKKREKEEICKCPCENISLEKTKKITK